MKTKIFSPFVFLMAVIMLSSVRQAIASEVTMPTIDFNMLALQKAGSISDGTLLGQGRITYSESHAGFILGADADKTNRPGGYMLSGVNNTSNKLYIRMESEGAMEDTQQRGIIILTDQNSAAFRIKVDGNQNITSDKWRLSLHAVAILP